jgi:cytochrome P450
MSPTYHGPSAESFNGLRWVEDEQQQQGDGKSKSKGPKGAATINQTYFPFGLGRWACPGRVLAVSGESESLSLVVSSGFSCEVARV